MQRRAKRRTSARMDQWTRSLSKVAPQSRICVKTWTLPYSGQAFDRLYRPTAGQDMRHQRGHFQWQTTPAITIWPWGRQLGILRGRGGRNSLPYVLPFDFRKHILRTHGFPPQELLKRYYIFSIV